MHIYRTVRADEDTFPKELPDKILKGMAEATLTSMAMLDHGGHAWVGWLDLVSAPEVANSIFTAVASQMTLPESGVRFMNHKGIYRVWKGEQLDRLVYPPEIQ